MDSRQIYAILKQDKDVSDLNFLGVFPIDLIPARALKFPCCLVINTKPSTHPGEHWVCVVKTHDNRGIYFDSYGNSTFNLPEIGELFDGCVDWSFNSTRLQSQYSTVCGQYTIFVITHLARGYTLKHITTLINDCGDLYANDAFIFNYIKNKYANSDLNINELQVIDFPFIFNQISSPVQ